MIVCIAVSMAVRQGSPSLEMSQRVALIRVRLM